MLCDILVISMCFIPTPGTHNNNDGHLAVVICFFRVSCSVRCISPSRMSDLVHGKMESEHQQQTRREGENLRRVAAVL